MRCRPARALPALLLVLLATGPAHAQFGPAGPVPVDVITAEKRPVTESVEFIGRVQSTDKVEIVPRVTAFLDEIHFTEGTDVQKGDLLYVLERGPFEADLAAKQAAVAQQQALLKNATITLGRAQSLLNTVAGQRSVVDDALAQQASLTAQVQSAQAQLRQSQINLDYTEIHAPVSGHISRSNITVGNVVSPSSGALTTIYSQDPMYVLFPVSVRVALQLRDRYAARGTWSGARVKLKLSDGTTYGQVGTMDYVDPTVGTSTDTLVMRARIPNPVRPGLKPSDPDNRELIDGEFVTVILEGAAPVMALAIPRAAVLLDQQGTYVYVVGAKNAAEQRRVTLGQTSGAMASVLDGLKDGEQVIVDGLQKLRPGATVAPAPAGAGPQGGPAGGTAPASGGNAAPAGGGSAQVGSNSGGGAGGAPAKKAD
jgi:membrane fusion protein, multidrug efflux system